MSKHRKILVTALSLILCMSVSVGIAVAYFTDYENARGGAILHLKGQTWIDEKADDKSKTVVIQNVDEPDMVVRVMIIGDTDHLGAVTFDDNDWIAGDDGWYYYKRILKGCTDAERSNGGKTSPLKAEINVSGNEDINDFDIAVVQEAERVTYDGLDEDGNDIVSIPDGWSITSISAK